MTIKETHIHYTYFNLRRREHSQKKYKENHRKVEKRKANPRKNQRKLEQKQITNFE